MSPTNGQIIAEARRRAKEQNWRMDIKEYVIEVVRENWTPPEPVVDPDILAFREFASKEAKSASLAEAYLDGDMDSGASARLFLAGARMAREQERERAKVLADNLANLVSRVADDWAQDDVTGINASEIISARAILAKYRGEA